MKLCNFLRVDPSYEGKGLSAGAKGEEIVWNMYAGNRPELTKIAEAIRSSSQRQITLLVTHPLDDDDEAFPEGRVLTRIKFGSGTGNSLRGRRKPSYSQRGIWSVRFADSTSSALTASLGGNLSKNDQRPPGLSS